MNSTALIQVSPLVHLGDFCRGRKENPLSVVSLCLRLGRNVGYEKSYPNLGWGESPAVYPFSKEALRFALENNQNSIEIPFEGRRNYNAVIFSLDTKQIEVKDTVDISSLVIDQETAELIESELSKPELNIYLDNRSITHVQVANVSVENHHHHIQETVSSKPKKQSLSRKQKMERKHGWYLDLALEAWKSGDREKEGWLCGERLNKRKFSRWLDQYARLEKAARPDDIGTLGHEQIKKLLAKHEGKFSKTSCEKKKS